LTLGERITDADRLRSWKDDIPLRYEYTAGVAGERFLRGLQEGKILASRCGNCGRMYLPPKMYCINCYIEVRSYRAVGPAGTVAALAESHVDFEGRKLKTPRTFAFVRFTGVTGGLIHSASGKGLEIGSRVAPRFREARARKGTLLDIADFTVQ
jgi:uncharacterized OB-fold protein